MNSISKNLMAALFVAAVAVGCGSSDNNANNGGCASGQVNTVAGCGNTCTMPTGQQGGLVNNICQGVSSTTTATGTCVPPMVTWSAPGLPTLCCPQGVNAQYSPQSCTQVTGGATQCQPGWFMTAQGCVP